MPSSIIKYCFWFLLYSFIQINGFVYQQEYLFKQIRIEDGLSQSSVFSIIHDRKGYLWFGTANGLNRYNGYEFKVFINDPSDSNSISDNGIITMLEDNDGYIWIGTVEGVLNRYDRRNGTFKKYFISDTLKVTPLLQESYYDFQLPFSRHSDKTITSIAQGNDNFLWIGTWGMGLIRFDKESGNIKRFHYTENNPKGFNSNRVKSISVDGDIVWIGTLGAGLIKMIYNNGKAEFINYRNDNKKHSLSNDRIMSLYNDRSGNLWIGTYGGGLNLLEKNQQTKSPAETIFKHYSNDVYSNNSLSNNIVTAIKQDQFGLIWIGTYGGGLDKLNPVSNTFYNYKHNPERTSSLSKNDILTIFEDGSGNLWIGTHLGSGLSKLERNRIKFNRILRKTNEIAGLNDDVVWAITNDNENNIWVGTYKGGLDKWDRSLNSFKNYSPNLNSANSISDNHIRSLKCDGKGNLLIGTYSGGLNILNKKENKFYKYIYDPDDSSSLGANQVQSIFIDRNGDYWIGTFGGGLNKVKNKNTFPQDIEFIRYRHNSNEPFSISDDRVYTIFEDSEGILWIGTFGGGINKFDRQRNKFISYKNINGDLSSLSDNRVMTIHEDKEGFLWIGMYGGGLQKFNKQTEKFTRFDRKNLLNSSVVYGILEDNENNLWMSTDNGIFKFNIKNELFVQYDLQDGLQSMEFSGGAYYKTSKGEMFFGGINGFNYFFPDSIKENQFIPSIVISSVRVMNIPLKEEKDTLKLSYDNNFLTFEFAALDYTNPPDNQYAYMLDGFDRDWHYVYANNRIANYINLPPGEYIFKVRGSNNDGLWNYDGTSIYLIITPPFWKTWWFVTIFFFTTAFLIYYLSTIRYRNLLTIEKLKSKLSADLHDNIGSGLTEISILSELASTGVNEIDKETSKKLISISEKARNLIDTMSDIVWMVNPQRDSLYHLMLRLKDSYSELLHSMGISFSTVNLEKFSSIKLPMDYKQNLFLIFKESIHNAIKHSECKKIILEANINKDSLELMLKDDGKGLDIESIKYGNGILNMKSRAKVIGGELMIESSTNGTQIKFKGKTGSRNFTL